MICNKCGKEIGDKAQFCDFCGQKTSSGTSPVVQEIPNEIKGWSWGGFLMSWLWSIGNKTWIGLLALIPYAGLIMNVVLGVKGREWAWKNKQWESVDQFKKVQKNWAVWGVVLLSIIPVLGIVSVITLSAINPIEQVNRSKDAGTKADAMQVLTASEMFKADNGYYPWNSSNSSNGYTTENVSAESWMNLLVSTSIIQQDLITRLSENNLKLMLIQVKGTDGDVHICFRPFSATVLKEAQQACTSNGTFTNQQFQILCRTGNEYVCLP